VFRTEKVLSFVGMPALLSGSQREKDDVRAAVEERQSKRPAHA
jgi:hypothetical protein